MINRVKHLDVSHNPKLDESFYSKIGEIINDEYCTLEFVSFEGNQMGDKNLNIFSRLILDSIRLKVLNFSKNVLTDKSAENICAILRHCVTLRGLFLHYNKIRGPGGYEIANTIQENRNLEVFDISFNHIGGGIATKDQEKVNLLKTKYA